ncbi:MAG: sugar ABC transporter permease [Propionibacteriaceae bacterium]|jgi:arabinogalactan oligomer/maltooligosaccharide transport system permease protein|nr:sugar ABC transporter permease [Propionibacteriaceae bacterium]
MSHILAPQTRKPHSGQAGRRLVTGLVSFFLLVVALLIIWPVVHMVAAAFTPGQSVADMPIIPFSDGITLEHFAFLFSQTDYWRWFANTLIIAVCTCAVTMLCASLGAYVFSRFQFQAKKSMLMSMLVLNVFPSFVGMVAVYIILLRLGGLDTLWGLMLVYLAGSLPYATWMVKSYMDTIPRSMDEAARIDGASNFRVWWQIIMPSARPILTFLAVTSFTAPWMDFIFPKLVLRSPENLTLALGLYNFVTDKNNFFTNFTAGAILVAIPFMIFFIATQRFLTSSLAGASVKE